VNGRTGVVTTGATYSDGTPFAAGEVISVTVTAPLGEPVASLEVPTGTARSSAAAPTTLTYTAVGVETSVTVINVGTGAIGYTWSCVAAVPHPPPNPIPAWVQAYGIFHQHDACLTSWTNSWQKWAEPITGGWVCTRTIPSLG
jgi:hypothetical protein